MKMENLNKLIEEFQKKNSKKSQEILFQKYYKNACRWAMRYVSRNTYTDLIKYEECEVKSFVFLSFWKALKTYNPHAQKTLSFKNYFFQMIKYQMLQEMKKTFNWQTISNYQEKCTQFIKEQKINAESQEYYYEKLDATLRCEVILKFLAEKNIVYAQIFKLKSTGCKNPEICKKLNLTGMEMKSRYQYIKKLILSHFSKIENVS